MYACVAPTQFEPTKLFIAWDINKAGEVSFYMWNVLFPIPLSARSQRTLTQIERLLNYSAYSIDTHIGNCAPRWVSHLHVPYRPHETPDREHTKTFHFCSVWRTDTRGAHTVAIKSRGFIINRLGASLAHDYTTTIGMLRLESLASELSGSSSLICYALAQSFCRSQRLSDVAQETIPGVVRSSVHTRCYINCNQFKAHKSRIQVRTLVLN